MTRRGRVSLAGVIRSAFSSLLCLACASAPPAPANVPVAEIAPAVETPRIEDPEARIGELAITTAEAPIDPACFEPEQSPLLIPYDPPCDFAPITHFWRWPGNVVVVPGEAGLGSCHDYDYLFPARSETCPEIELVREVAAGDPSEARSALVVQLGSVAMPGYPSVGTLREIDRIGAERFVLSLEIHHALDLSLLAPFADRLVALFLGWHCQEERCDVDLATLPALPNLRSLSIGTSVGNVRGIASLARHAALRALGIGADLDATQEAALGALGSIEELRVSADVPAALAAMRGLERLHFHASEVNVRAITSHPRLELLVADGAISDAALANIARMRALRELRIEIGAMTDAGARSLRRARTLRSLIVHVPPERFEDGAEVATPPPDIEVLPSLTELSRVRVRLESDTLVELEPSARWRRALCPSQPEMCEEEEPEP
jgi:hypothetical protein